MTHRWANNHCGTHFQPFRAYCCKLSTFYWTVQRDRSQVHQIRSINLSLTKNALGCDDQCDQMLKLKVAQFFNCSTKCVRSSFYLKFHIVQISPKSSQIFGLLWNKINHEGLLKVAQSGHTGDDPTHTYFWLLSSLS